MMKILLIIVFLWMVYRINKLIAGIQINKSNNRRKENKSRQSEMDILDADYEEME